MLKESEFKKLWNLNPSFSNEMHNYKNTYNYLSMILDNNSYLSSGEELTFQLIHDRYKEYIINWQRGIGKRGDTFIGKDDKLKSLYDYISLKLYESTQREIPIEADPRYQIIFGGISEDVIRKHFKNFRDTIYGK